MSVFIFYFPLYKEALWAVSMRSDFRLILKILKIYDLLTKQCRKREKKLEIIENKMSLTPSTY